MALAGRVTFIPMRGASFTILDAIADAVIVCDDADRLSYVNVAGERLLATSFDALALQPIETIVPTHLRQMDGVPFYRYLAARADRGRPFLGAVLRADNVEIAREITAALVDLGGSRPGVVATLRRPREALTFDAEPREPSLEPRPPANPHVETYRAVFEHAPMGIFHFDENALLTATNDRFVEMLGSTKRLVIGIRLFTLPNAEVVAAIKRALEGHDSSYEGPYMSATGGKSTWVRCSFSPIFEGQKVVGGVGLVDDLTTQKHTEDRLREADRMASLGTLAAGVAHEINNPLTYIRTGLELAMRELATLQVISGTRGTQAAWQRLNTTLTSCRDGVERVRVIAGDLKAFSRGDDAVPRLVNIEACADAAINLAANELRHHATVVRDYGRVAAVFGSETRFVQVLVNLLVNAAQALPEGETSRHTVTVRTRDVAPDQVCVEVIDTGKGIAADVLGRIFEPFFTDKPPGVGTGLGLSICHGIISSAGGRIEVKSRVGEGSTFRVILPKAAERTQEAETRVTIATERPAPRDRARVLIIDDEAKLAWTLRMALSDQHDVVTMASGREAVAAIERGESFDLILCDLMMPELSGMDVYDAVARLRPELLRRFVFMTGGAFTERARAFLQDPDVRRLEKPFLIQDVEALLPPPSA